MIGLLLCVVAFAGTLVAAQRSLLAGLCAALAVGYAYGYMRAVAPSSAAHFIFDCAVLGLYLAQLFRTPGPMEQREPKALRLWILALCAWPILLLAVPTQEPLVQLVGLRAAIFLLPFMLLGARLGPDNRYRLALWCAALNLVAFAFAVGEFTLGLERFLPHNAVTELVYKQSDVGNLREPRIPSTFPTSHAYGGTMVVTLPLLLGAWARRGRAPWHRVLLLSAMIATGLGVFLAASRYHTLVLFALLVVALLSGRVRLVHRVGAVLAILLVGLLVSKESRLQRFTSLQDTDYVATRVSYSANRGLLEAVAEHPMGNGLGGGGTNMPYFLQNRVRDLVVMENEYAKIAFEQGIPGLVLWVVFLGWAFGRRASAAGDPWHLGRRLAWWAGALYFGTAWIGLGMLTAVPQSALLLLGTGWVLGGSVRARGRAPATGAELAAARESGAPPRITLVRQEGGRASA